MHEKIQNVDDRIIYLYRITCLINQKNYIGQSVDPTSRWRAHKRDSANPKVPIQFAIKKHGIENFEFEVIACCKTQDAANELETALVKQYNSFVANGNGYNATHGGFNSPKSEMWKENMRKWHASMSPEEKETRSRQLSEATFRQIEEQGHPCQGHIWTEESRLKLSESLKARDKEKIYSPEVRQKMSESHLGKEISKEQRAKMVEGNKKTHQKRKEELLAAGELKCNAPGCEAYGIEITYQMFDDIRYCLKHYARLKKTGFLELQKHPSPNLGKKHTEETRQKLRGRVPHNRIEFSPEQMQIHFYRIRDPIKKLPKILELRRRLLFELKR